MTLYLYIYGSLLNFYYLIDTVLDVIYKYYFYLLTTLY
jgi:hypothetical protein